MEPDVLASAGDPAAVSRWAETHAVQTEDSPKVETPAYLQRPRLLPHLNEADGRVFKIARDPRTPPIGRFMRSTSLDEVPQFWNVLLGDMSLVGPRPPIPEEVAKYEPWQLRRLDVRPGLTCLWQISGRSRIGFQEGMRLDLEYIRHRSLRLDFEILFGPTPAGPPRAGAHRRERP